MRPCLHPRMVNGPFGDPGVFVSFLFENRALLLDLGDGAPLSNRDLLKVSHAFVSHTHMDHFVGFDRLLRLCLGREKRLRIYGPTGFLRNVAGKLAGYAWNLTPAYENRFAIIATEVRATEMITLRYLCRNRFRPDRPAERVPFSGVIHEEPALTVFAEIFDHDIPCLGFAVKERFHINILKDRAVAAGLSIGKWLKGFKEALYAQRPPDTPIAAPLAAGGEIRMPLGELSERIAMITPGQKIAYITDVAPSPEGEARMTRLAEGADQLFIEAAFLDADRDLAAQKRHLTARQAGRVAGGAGVKRLTLFHFSPRYAGREAEMRAEAEAAMAEG